MREVKAYDQYQKDDQILCLKNGEAINERKQTVNILDFKNQGAVTSGVMEGTEASPLRFLSQNSVLGRKKSDARKHYLPKALLL